MNRLRVASLAATLGLSITAHSGDIIKDRSPDGRFALQLCADQDAFELGLIDLGTHKELVSLNSLGSPYANHSSLLWSPDSKRVAYTEDSRRGGYTAITLDPKNVNAYNNRGTEKQNAGDIAVALISVVRSK